jgi:RimJ/RimL family protein N-acetyltransferase
MPHVIATPRLELRSMGPDFLRASLAGERARAEALLGASLAGDWADLSDVLRIRLAQLEGEPGQEPWLTRAVVAREDAAVVGVAGFHGPPGGAWLAEVAPGGVEFGYTIHAPWRRRGYAFEAAGGLMRWATEEHGVTRFVLSIGPDNPASAALARKLGFARVGAWEHAERGLEHVYRAERPGPPAAGEPR